jgi:hypothetical protein
MHCLRQELQRHGLAELQVVRPIDLAHPAVAQEPDDAVAPAQDSSGYETGLNRYGTETADGSPFRLVSVGAEVRSTAAPQSPQKRFPSGYSLPHEGHCAIHPVPGRLCCNFYHV